MSHEQRSNLPNGILALPNLHIHLHNIILDAQLIQFLVLAAAAERSFAETVDRHILFLVPLQTAAYTRLRETH